MDIPKMDKQNRDDDDGERNLQAHVRKKATFSTEPIFLLAGLALSSDSWYPRDPSIAWNKRKIITARSWQELSLVCTTGPRSGVVRTLKERTGESLGNDVMSSGSQSNALKEIGEQREYLLMDNRSSGNWQWIGELFWKNRDEIQGQLFCDIIWERRSANQ